MSSQGLRFIIVLICVVLALSLRPASAASSGEDTAPHPDLLTVMTVDYGAEENAAPYPVGATTEALPAAMLDIVNDVLIAPLPGAAGMGICLLVALTLQRRRRGRGPQPIRTPSESRFSPRKLITTMFSA